MNHATAQADAPVAAPLFERAAAALLAAQHPHLAAVPDLDPGLPGAVARGLERLLASRDPASLAAWCVHTARDPEYPEPDDGLIRKDAFDRKCYFHFRPDLQYLLHAKNGVSLTETERIWFDACMALHARCANAAKMIARGMDRQRPGFAFEARLNAHADQHTLRIVRYDAGYTTAARWHVDRCAFTLHVAESEPGLVVRAGWDEQLCASPRAPNVMLFSGKTLERITRGAIPALWHGAKDQSRCTRPRWAIVFFAKMKRDADMY